MILFSLLFVLRRLGRRRAFSLLHTVLRRIYVGKKKQKRNGTSGRGCPNGREIPIFIHVHRKLFEAKQTEVNDHRAQLT